LIEFHRIFLFEKVLAFRFGEICFARFQRAQPLDGQPFRRPFRRFFAKTRNLNVSLRLTALSLTLSHGEREQIGRNPKRRGNKLVESLKMVGFQHPQSPLPRREETKLAGNPKHGWVNEALDFLSKNMGIKKTLRLVG